MYKDINKHWSRKSNREEVIEKISATKTKRPTRYWKGKHLSPEHNAKLQAGRDKLKGKNHPRWKGGVTPKHNTLRGSLEYVLWRNDVYKRDKWTCRICKKHCQKGSIVAHHLKKFADFPELRFVIDNGITLCRKCHAEIENPKRRSL